MLLIIELLFIVAGLWAFITGKLPVGLFKFLFGKGEYELTSNQTRIFGLFLASPLPVSFIGSFLLVLLLGERAVGYAIIFEYIYILTVIITSVIVARKARHPETKDIDNSLPDESSLEQKTNSYGSRLLIMSGIVILGLITACSIFSLIGAVISSVTYGVRVAGEFWEDIFPFILMFTIIGFGSFGIFKLVQKLRK